MNVKLYTKQDEEERPEVEHSALENDPKGPPPIPHPGPAMVPEDPEHPPKIPHPGLAKVPEDPEHPPKIPHPRP